MGDKRLNFNRPLLSVRRFSPTVANSQKDSKRKNGSSNPALLPSPSYRSDLHSGPLRNPGTVPFVWEQIPGRPKDEGKTQKPPVVPNPPPGRILKPKRQDIEEMTKGFYVEKGPVIDSFERSEDSKKEISRSWNGDISRENEKPPPVTYGPNFLQLNDDDTEDDNDFEYDEHGHMPPKFCGLLPHFCLKGSIGMINQTPGLSVRTRLPVSSANRTRVSASSAGSQDATVAAIESKSSVKHQKDPTVLNHESTENTNQKNSKKLEQVHGNSYNHNESSPPSIVSEEKEVNIQKKGLVSFKELLAQERLAHEKEKETNFANPTFEKTLYVDTVHKVESLRSEFKETDGDIFGITHIPAEQFGFDYVADNSRHDKEMITQTGVCKDPKVDQKVEVSQKPGSELPAPPPLPKSPSDSWLWRTLPSMNSKAAPLWSNNKTSSKTTKQGKNVQSRYPQGLLLPISET